MVFLFETWFWRGTQSAVAHYLGCVPCHQARYVTRRRREAEEAEKAAGQRRVSIEMSQPGVVRQPHAFRTNPAWAEEIAAGPGPPKRIKKQRDRAGTASKRDATAQTKQVVEHGPQSADAGVPISTVDATSSSSSEMLDSLPYQPLRLDPTRRMSTMVSLKEGIRTTLHPDRWNFKRYEREDEILETHEEYDDRLARKVSMKPAPPARRRTETMESDRRYDYLVPRNPAVNDLHPPVVSQLSRRREDVAWMLLPPPSRDVMEGKVRPRPEAASRRALAIIGRTKAEEEEILRDIAARKAQPTLSMSQRWTVNEERSDEDVDQLAAEDDNEDEGTLHTRAVSLPDVLNIRQPPLAANPPVTEPKATQKRLSDQSGTEWDYYIKLQLAEIPGRQGRERDRLSLPGKLLTQPVT